MLFSFLDRYPMINDITTTPDAPPAYQALAQLSANSKRDMTYPKKFTPLQKSHYSDIAPMPLSLPADSAFELVMTAAKQMPDWQIVAADKNTRRLEAVAVTKLLRFKDDVVIEVRVGSGSDSTIHMRSKSRLGRNDFGANAARIRAFFVALKRLSK